MKFLKKNIKVTIFTIVGIMIGILLTGGIVFAAGQLNASEVTYNTNTVAGALDNLYNYAKNKSDLAEEMMKPNTWEVSTTESPKEYNFGDGVYGQRFTGTITADAKTIDRVTLAATGVKNIINAGGSWVIENNQYVDLHSYYADYWWDSLIMNQNHTGFSFDSYYKKARTNTPYDIWVLYTKTN